MPTKGRLINVGSIGSTDIDGTDSELGQYVLVHLNQDGRQEYSLQSVKAKLFLRNYRVSLPTLLSSGNRALNPAGGIFIL